MGAVLGFRDLVFEDKEDFIRVYFLKYFYFDMPKQELEKIADFSIDKNKIMFDTIQIKAERQFNRLISKHIDNDLKTIKGTRAKYIYKPPIIGSLRFGLVDRDTNCIEIRPVTGCNLNCIYCSIDEGIESNRTDYIIDKNLLVSEFKKLIENKKLRSFLLGVRRKGASVQKRIY